MVSMRFLPALLLLFATAAGQEGACPMTMWVFEDSTSCGSDQVNPLTPDSTGTIYADNTCHTVDPSSNADLFPGSYVAECTSDGQVTFYSSGCTSEECTDSSGDGRCDLNFATISAFYSLLSPPTHDVLDPSTQEDFIPCKTMSGTGSSINLTVTFAIFGDCSIPECQGVTSPPATSPSTAAPVATTSPTVDLTDPPTEAPVTPTLSPTETEPTESPTDAPPPSSSPSLQPSIAPFPGSTSAPSEEAVPTTSPTLEPTEDKTTPAPQAEQPQATPPPSSSVTTDTVYGLSLLLTEMSGRLAGEDKEEWQDLTAEQVKDFYKDDSIEDLSVNITIGSQQLTASQVSRGRRLQTSYILRIDFQADLGYVGDKVDGTQLIASAFDSQEDRTAYIKSLQEENALLYANLNKVELLDDGMPVVPPITVEPDGGTSIGVVIGAAVGGVVLLGALAAAFLYSKKKRQAKPPSSISASPIEESPQKSHITSTVSLGTPDAHITTISLGTPDDVSTLGDPVLAGMKFVDADGEDENTASVNDMDYDYVKQQRARLASQDSKKSLDSKSYFPSTLGGMESDVMADDSSFEALFQDNDNGPREERLLVIAPPGKLGMVLDTPPGEGPLVHAINENSVLKGRVMVGDRLITVDKEDVSTLSAAKVSVLITQKSQQERTFEFIRGKKR